ncbi:MAG TPA: histidine kinase, partial [Casimicrobiaceae bacterium]|nr:histidine kinase [Casimicrobiaceae bacterium]
AMMTDRSGATCDPQSSGFPGHPLEALPFFRRIKPFPGRGIVYTLIFNAMFAAVFSAFWLLFDPQVRLTRVLWVNLVIANCIGFFIHGGFALGNRLVGRWLQSASFAARSVYFSIVYIMGVFAGYALGAALLDWPQLMTSVFSPKGATSVLLLTVIISVIMATIFFARERQAKAEAEFQRERARVEAAEKQIRVAQLQLLEAQIEPHFLYNTLANVISLIDAEPATAKHMIERLIDYLRRAALVAGGADATLGRQVELLRAYLDLIVLRMGSRLSYRIDVPPELAALPLPPMLLQPVVENAIKHGIEPKIAGGEVSVTARRQGDRLLLEVTDDGLGVRATRAAGSTGLGLANLRERLWSMHGVHATLAIEDWQPGTRVTIDLPMLTQEQPA